MRKLKAIIAFVLLNIPIVLRRFYLFFYRKLKLDYVNLIFFHRYSAHTFNPIHLKNNVKLLLIKEKKDYFAANREGKLFLVRSKRGKIWLFIQNGLFLGAFSARLKRVVYLTIMSLSLELKNPFNRAILKRFLKKKVAFLNRIAKRVEFDRDKIQTNIDLFLRNSIIQDKVIREMHLAVKRQREPAIIKRGKEGLARGLFPVLIEHGRSGSYWIRSKEREVLGIFKPFDEECFAPHNPAGAISQGPLGARKMRRGTRVGESAHNEVAAFLLDSFLGFGIVPKTYYASFTHHVFFLASEKKHYMRGSTKTKYGSFQEYIEGFIPIGHLDEDEISLIPLEEFQMLILFDVIVGNSDRHFGNLLIGEQKIAAIDHGYCFPDVITSVMTTVWENIEHGKKAFHPSLKKLVHHFPLEEIGWKLRKKCFRSLKAIERMRERIALFKAGLDAELTPYEIAPLMKIKYLKDLYQLDFTLDAKAKEIVEHYSPDREKERVLERWLRGN